MFFDIILLNRQHRAGFGKAWLAATRGIRHVKKTDVLSTDIVKLCNDIESYIGVDADTVRSRFSLRLSSILTNGTVKLYNAKANYIIDDFLHAYTAITTPVYERSVFTDITVLRTPPSPLVRKKTKKRRIEEKETPSSVLEQLTSDIRRKEPIVPEPLFPQREVILQSRTEEITIREEQPIQREQVAEWEDFGIAPTEEELSRIVGPLPEVVPHTKKVSSSSSSAPNGAEIITVQAQIHVSAEIEQPTVSALEPIQETEERIRIVEDITILPSAPIQRAEVDEAITVEEAPEETKRKEAEKRKKKAADMKHIFIQPNTGRRKVLKIDRCQLHEAEFLDTSSCPVPKFTLQFDNLTALLQKYLIQESDDSQKRKVSEGSVEHFEFVQPKHVTPPVAIRVESPPTLLLQSPIIESSTPAREAAPDVTIEQVMAAAAEKQYRLSPRKRLKLSEDLHISEQLHSELPSKLASHEITDVSAGLPVEEVSLPVLTEQERQQDMIDKIFLNKKVTLDEVCQKPINRLNIARAFGDALVLCKYHYVNLVAEEGSCELKYIEVGPKMSK